MLTTEQIAWLQRNKAMSGGGSAFGQGPAPGATSQPPAATPQIMDETWKAPPRGPVAPAPLAAGTGDPSTPSAAPPTRGTTDLAAPAKAQITATYGVRFTPTGQPAGYQLPGAQPGPQAKKWEPNEVDTVDRAFKAIPKEDKGILQDITLSRVTSLPGGGDTLAEFQDAEDSQAGTVTRTILVTDGNFSAKRGQSLSNDEPARGIVHEVGHAIAHNARDKAELVDVKAIQAITDAQAEYKKAEAEHDAWKKQQSPEPTDRAGMIRRDKAEEPYANAQLAAWHKVEAAQDARKLTEKAVADTKVPKAIVDAGQAHLNSSVAQADGESTRVTSDLSKMSPDQLKASKDYRTASSAITVLLDLYSFEIKEGKVGPGQDQKSPNDWDDNLKLEFTLREDYRKALASRDRNNPALTILAPFDRTQDSLRKEVQTQARLPERVPKVQEFVELVNNAPAIDPKTISDYAADSWPHKPEEFFAECYSIWRMNRSRLPDRILKWFDGGLYRSGSGATP
jgi:hypothetical protein